MVTGDARKGVVKIWGETYTHDPDDRKIGEIRKVYLPNMTTSVR